MEASDGLPKILRINWVKQLVCRIMPGIQIGKVMCQCKNCGRPIGNLERAFAWENTIVCGPCYAKLSAPYIVNPDQVFDSIEDLPKSPEKQSPAVPAATIRMCQVCGCSASPIKKRNGSLILTMILCFLAVVTICLGPITILFWAIAIAYAFKANGYSWICPNCNTRIGNIS